jgi:hypothetical protein
MFNRAQNDFYLQGGQRTIILKARQIGLSTVTLARYYHNTITNVGTNTVIVAQKREQAELFLETIKLFYEQTPPEWQPTIQYNSKYELTFKSQRSSLRIASPTDDVGRGQTIHNLHASELAFWPNAERAWAGLLESVPTSGSITIESTPNGIGNLFYRLWTQAQTGNSQFKPLIYPWWWEYAKEWADAKLADIGPDKFAQEYDCDFLQSGRPVFRQEYLKFPTREGAHQEAGVVLYEQPIENQSYVIGADTAEGLVSGDYSVGLILERESAKVVGVIAGHWAPEVFANILVKYGKLFNSAFIGVERNNHGHTVLLQLKNNYSLSSIYTYPEDKKLGWLTSAKTKPLMIDELEEAIRKGLIEIPDESIKQELIIYQYNDNGSTSAPEGFHDDRVMALAIAWQIRKRKEPRVWIV